MSYSLTVTEKGVSYVAGVLCIDAHCIMDKGRAVGLAGFVRENGRLAGTFTSVRGLYKLMECYYMGDLPQLVEGLRSHAMMATHGELKPDFVEALAYPIGIGEG